MPKPVFVVCAVDGSVDRFTNRLSLFNILENIVIQEVPGNLPDVVQLPPLKFKAVAVWAAEEVDAGKELEHELLIDSKMAGPKQLALMPFAFSSRLHRFYISVGVGITATKQQPDQSNKKDVIIRPEGGMLHIISRVRYAGSDKWFSQEYELPIERVQIQPAPKYETQ